MNWRTIVSSIVEQIKNSSSIEGVFLSGSLIDENKDRYSDIDLGIASRNSSESFRKAYSLRHRIVAAVGQPVQFIERGWEHCRMIATLYAKSQFPPNGLEVDVVFSQLKHVSEQMPYADYEVVFDRSGRLKRALDAIARRKPKREIERELKQQLNWFPFYVHDAVKAYKRRDLFNLQSLLEEMRKAIFFAAATQAGGQVYGAKRVFKFLSVAERQIIETSYRESTERTIQSLTESYVACLTALQSDYHIEQDVERFRASLRELI